MGRKSVLSRKCKTCQRPITDWNKSGFCNKHRDRHGANNAFYGKHHKQETVEKIKSKTSIKSKELWQNPEYAKKVIKGVSKPRREGFKKEQSERTKQWYIDNPEQRELRSVAMKYSWEEGKILNNSKGKRNSNASKLEIDFAEELKKITVCETKVTIHIGHKWFLPDVFVKRDGVVIEFLGNFYHCNPKFYKANYFNKKLKKYATEIWEADEKRQRKLEEEGFKVIVIWEEDYKKNKKAVLDYIDAMFNWEVCTW